MVPFALVLVLLQLINYSGVQCQQPTSTGISSQYSLTTNLIEVKCSLNFTYSCKHAELQRLTEEVAQVKESINNLLQAFAAESALVREKLGDVGRECTCKNDEMLQTCSKLALATYSHS